MQIHKVQRACDILLDLARDYYLVLDDKIIKMWEDGSVVDLYRNPPRDLTVAELIHLVDEIDDDTKKKSHRAS